MPTDLSGQPQGGQILLSNATSFRVDGDASAARAYPGLARPINLRSAAFNEQYTQGSLLLEIGAFGNTLSDVKTAARLLGGELAAVILSGN